mgnify:CR=1 FL=1
MSQPIVVRYADADALADRAAARLLQALIRYQAEDRVAQVCLTGGRTALRIYARLAELAAGSELDPSRLELWWGAERFVPTGDPARSAGPTLATLAGQFPLDPARTHPMPAADGLIDAFDGAAAYAKELGDTRFDLVLLGLGEDGHVAALFPDHSSSEPTTQTVIGVTDAPTPPSECITLTVGALSRAGEVWFLVSGAEKATVLRRALDGDQRLPAARVHGEAATWWLVDQAAARELPYFECSV